MGLTLDELKNIEKVLRHLYGGKEVAAAYNLIQREIRLKELEKQIPKTDVSGIGMEE